MLEPLVQALNDGVETVGIDAWHGSLRHGVLESLKARMASVRFLNNGGLLKQIRIVKSDAEIRFLRESARITAEGLRAAVAAVQPGVTDNDIAAEGARALLEAGSEFMSMQPIVVTGRRSSVIHCNHKRTVVQEGDPVFLEFGSAWHRYTAPMMQTVVAGAEPSSEMRKVHDGCRRVVDTLLASVRPGVTFDQAAQDAESTPAIGGQGILLRRLWLHGGRTISTLLGRGLGLYRQGRQYGVPTRHGLPSSHLLAHSGAVGHWV